MDEINKELDLISHYLSSFEDYVKLNNSVGLFDAAKLFELFAANLGEIYFGQQFINLNFAISNYPSVDLISSTGKILVQVTTVNNLPSKIKETLKSLKELSRPELNNVEELFFFSLNNESVKKIKEFFGSKRIGRVDFKRSNLITTKDVYSRAVQEKNFRLALYSYLKRLDSSLKDSKNIEREIRTCKSDFLLKGKDTIGESYKIDVSNYINEVLSDAHKNILIEGPAGVGKTVICRKLFEKEKFVFYAKATQFSKALSFSDIWHFNVEDDLEFLHDQKIVFIIDALEYVTDLESIPTLLTRLYEITKDYHNIHVVSSCRTSDKAAFVRLFAKYDVSPHLIKEINDDELTKITKAFPAIKKALTISGYSELVKIPFYLDMMVEVGDISSSENENTLKDKIWKRITKNDNHIAQVVTKIVLDRSRQFATGVNKDDYDSNIVNVLLSNNVLECDDSTNTIRLAYDIFEDICFERHIDRLFNDSKEDMIIFFDELNQLGRAAYRRYQIWLDDKLLIKKDRDLFLYNLLFSHPIPEKWRENTIIGIIKSKNSDAFFDEFGDLIIDRDLLETFIRYINLYGYEIDEIKTMSPFLSLKSIGNGRKNVLHLIYLHSLYMSSFLESKSFEKVMYDFSRATLDDKLVQSEATLIIQWQLDYFLSEAQEDGVYYVGLFERIKTKLEILYQLCEEKDAWFLKFLDRIKNLFVSKFRDERHFSSDVLINLFESHNYKIVIRYQKEVCSLFEMFYTYKTKSDYPFYQITDDNNSAYGLNDNAGEYEHRTFRQYPIMSSFAYMFFLNKPIDGLMWLVSFINKCVNSYKTKHNLKEYELVFFGNDGLVGKKKYFGKDEYWYCITTSNLIPILLSDLIYCYKEAIRTKLKSSAREAIKIANIVKDYIYNNSNNLLLLTVILGIGIDCSEALPGYALDLITNMDILFLDYQRVIFQINGNSSSYILVNRYSHDDTETHLSKYMLNSQLHHMKTLLPKCQAILDYLYSVYPNDKNNAPYNFQIQKMDIRKAVLHKNGDYYIFESKPTGVAKEYANTASTNSGIPTEISAAVQHFDKKIEENDYTITECENFVELILKQTDFVTLMLYKEKALDVVGICLNDDTLKTDTREKYCLMLIDEVHSALSNTLLIRKFSFFSTLLEQLKKNINEEIKKQIKKLIFDILNEGHRNSINSSLIPVTRKFLSKNKRYAVAIFNTFLMLAKDEMEHQKFNANYIIKKRIEKDFSFKPNCQPHLKRIDQDIELNGDSVFSLNTAKIINDYLFDEKELNLCDFNIDNYDIQILNRIFDCGLGLNDQTMYLIANSFVDFLIQFWASGNKFEHEVVGVYETIGIKELLQRSLLLKNDYAYALKLLFENKDYLMFKSNTINFYLDIFSQLPAYYFNGSEEKGQRRHCENVLYKVEAIVIGIKNDTVRRELERVLIFSPGRYGLLGDWSKIKVSFTTRDKIFLSEMFEKYGFNHVDDVINVIYKFHYGALFPEMLPALAFSLIKAKESTIGLSNRNDLSKTIADNISILHILINSLFFDFENAIKHKQDYISAYENMLRVMISFGDEQAAILLDEFRMH